MFRRFLMIVAVACLVSGCVKTQETLQELGQDFRRRVQQSAEFTLANEHLISGHTRDQCQFAHFDWQGSFALIFDAPTNQQLINFWGHLIEARGGRVAPQGQNNFDAHIFLVARGAVLRAELLVAVRGQDVRRTRPQDFVAMNAHAFSLERQWSTFSYDQQLSILNAAAPFLINTACANR